MNTQKKSKKRRPLRQGSATQRELSRLVYEMQLLERPLSPWDEDALKGHISRRAKAAVQAKINKQIKKYNLLAVQKRLVEQELLELEEVENNMYLKLTSRGKIEAIKDLIINTKVELPIGEKCLVSFDIPEHIRNIRWHIRKFLKDAGFEMVHLSLWQSTKDVAENMVCLVKELGATKWIKVFKTKTSV